MYKQPTSSRESDDLSIGFDRSRSRREAKLAKNKNVKCIFHVRIMLKDVFGFAEHHETGTYAPYKLTLSRNTDNALVNKKNATNNAKIKINAIEWYVPHYTPGPEKCKILMNQIVKKLPTELHYPQKSVFMKEVKTQYFWTSELGTQESVNDPISIYVVSNKAIGHTVKL